MISCTVNFKENLTKNIPYYKLLLKQMNDAQGTKHFSDGFIGEQAALYSGGSEVLSKICEGYQFIISFDGELTDKATLTSCLKTLGYCFTTESDAELALLAYIHFGEKSPEKLNGCFSYVIYDTMRRQTFAASDLFASSPLFYAKTGDMYLFASQIRGILAHPDIRPTLTATGISRLLNPSGHYTGSIFDGIEMLPPAHILKISGDNVILKQYSIPSYDIDSSEKFLIPILTDSIETSEKTGVILSDNASDRLLCCIVAEKHAKKFSRIYTYSTESSAISKKYTSAHTQIIADESAIYTALKACVNIHGMPVLSGSDYLLSLIFKSHPNDCTHFITSQPDIFIPHKSMQSILNNILHPAVAETILPQEDASGFIYCGSRQIGESFGASVKTPLLCHSLYKFITEYPNQATLLFKAALKAYCCEEQPTNNLLLIKKLRHILLEIIASDTAPILAFFSKGTLLKLCERGLSSYDDLDEAGLLCYIIKLNIWLNTFRPVII